MTYITAILNPIENRGLHIQNRVLGLWGFGAHCGISIGIKDTSSLGNLSACQASTASRIRF